ncbi:MAG TPA: hypothetical protein VFA94_00830 [Acidimicrobiales bacterium]|nr:hypothetical protein [Acidimicrobiales bacterium]
MRGRAAWAAAVVIFSLPLAACTGSTDNSLSAKQRSDFLDASVHAPRQFVFQRELGGARSEVRGAVADDYRYQAEVAAGGALLYREVVVDDRRFVKLDKPVADVVAGAWVADASGAPGEFARRAVGPLSGGAVLDAVRALEAGPDAELFKTAVKTARRYDPKSSDYVKRNDKFPPHSEDGVRYDALPGAYQPDLLFRQGIPPNLEQRLRAAFLYASFWFKDGRITRIETLFDIDVKRVAQDMRSALDVQAKATGGRLDPSTLPPTPGPYRETYTFQYPKDPPVVTPPAATATVRLPGS